MALPLVENEEEAGKYVPVFSRALDGIAVATSHLSAAFRKNIRTMVLLSCGTYQSTLDSNTTVLITKRNGGEKYFAAARSKIPSVTPQWIRDVFRTSTFITPHNYIVPPFSKFIFCATGFTREERQRLETKILLQGGSWSPELKRTVTHLIVDLDNHDNNSKKLRYALQWGVKVVSQFWVRACIENGFYCPTDDSTRHLLPSNTSKQNSPTNPPETSPNESSAGEKGPFPAISTFARYAGLTPAPQAMSRETSTVTSGESDTNAVNHSSWMNGSNIGNTPFRKVSVRQSHLDLRAHISKRRKFASTTKEAIDDELEGDKPDDVDADSEEEGEVVLATSQPVLPGKANLQKQSITDSLAIQNARNNTAIEKPVEPKNRTTNTETDTSALYEDLDRQTQEQLVSHALDVYFKGPMMDEEQAVEAQINDRNLLDASKSYHLFDGVVISIIGVPRKESRGSLDEKAKKQLEELELAEEEFVQRGGSLALPSNANRILIFNSSLITRQEYAVIRDREVLSSDWLTDSILLELLQIVDTYRLTWSSEKSTYQSMTPKFWTSSCVIGSEKTSPKVSDQSTRSQFHRSAIAVPEKESPKAIATPAPITSAPIREPAVDKVALHKRQILPPTSVSASHLLLKSALHVNTLRKMHKIQTEGKAHAKNRDQKSHRDTRPPHHQNGRSDDIHDHTQTKTHHPTTARPPSERPGATESKTSKSRPSSTSHLPASRSGNGPLFDAVDNMGLKDLKDQVEKRKSGLSLPESESDSDSIVGSPLTISAKMQSLKKRKPAPVHERPLLDLQGVKKWKLQETEDTHDHQTSAEDGQQALPSNQGTETEKQASSPAKMAIPSEDLNVASLASLQSDPMDSDPDSYRSQIPHSTLESHHDSGDRGAGDSLESGVILPDFLTQTMRGEKAALLLPSHLLEPAASGARRLQDTHSPLILSSTPPGSLNAGEYQSFEERTSMNLDDELMGADAQETGERKMVVIQALTPSSGPKDGGDSVIVTLDRVEPDMRVVFGSVEAETICHTTKAKLWATAPPSAIALPVPVSIINGLGHKINSDSTRFNYSYV